MILRIAIVFGLGLAVTFAVLAEDAHSVKVDARDNPPRNPAHTGLIVKAGQRVLIEPNAEDRWHDGSGKFSYKGGKKGHMALMWGVGTPTAKVTSPKFVVTADKAGEIVLGCAEHKGMKDNSGFIHVIVTLDESPKP